MEYSTYTPQFWIENNTMCTEILKDENFWENIPSLNANALHNFKDNCLVRFQGMIQDMRNPEFYFEKYVVRNQISQEKRVQYGKYRDTTDLSENEVIEFNCHEDKTSERHSLVVISFPGLNDWVYNIEKEKYQIAKSSDNDGLTVNKSVKRSVDETMETDCNESTAVNNNKNKKICTTSNSSANSLLSREHILNFPLPDRDGMCCLVKVYDNTESLKLNDMIDIIGFLSVDPKLTDLSYHNNQYDSDMELQTHNPPPSLVPRIHCVSYKKITYYNPLVKEISLENEMMLNLKQELTVLLTQLLFGDILAAEYLICHLISNVYLRKELMPIGNFSLNLSNIPAQSQPNYGQQFYEFLQLLLPKSHYLPLSLDNLNNLTFTPKKDYECNRLTSGILQLSNNTHLILDETKMQPGTLSPSGFRNLSAVASTIKNQKVYYDFQFVQMEFECDIPVLIVSEGISSLLPSDFHVKLQLDKHSVETFPHIIDASKHFLKPDLLNKLRVYLTKARHGTYNLSDDIVELVQNEFVKERQSNGMSANDLHQLLVLARLLCLSKGKESLDEECWREACGMEAKRKARLPTKYARS